jgi:hypothetical protein
MFQTSVMEGSTGWPWGLIAGLVAFAALLSGGYALI